MIVIKEEVRRKKSGEAVVKGSRSRDGGQGGGVQRKWWSKEEVGGRKWRKNTPHWEPLLSKWVSPGRGLQAGEEAPGSQLVWGSTEKGTVWLRGSGQEALIHPRSRSAFFYPSPKNQGKKKTNPNRSQQADEARTAVGW